MAGKLFGLGVGPGDPWLLTLKAKKILEEVDVIAYPVKETGEKSTALHIIEEVIDLKGREIAEIIFRMDRDLSKREQCRREAADQLMGILDTGKNVAMITLGDTAIYSTYTYVHQMIKKAGYETEITAGISSFSGGAAMAEISLVEGNEGLGVVSSLKGRENLEKALDCFENLVLMKAGSSMELIREVLSERGLLDHAMVFSNIGLCDEYIGALDTERQYGYFTTVIVKRNGLF